MGIRGRMFWGGSGGGGFSGGRVCVIEVEMRTGRLVVREVRYLCIFWSSSMPYNRL